MPSPPLPAEIYELGEPIRGRALALTPSSCAPEMQVCMWMPTGRSGATTHAVAASHFS